MARKIFWREDPYVQYLKIVCSSQLEVPSQKAIKQMCKFNDTNCDSNAIERKYLKQRHKSIKRIS